MKLTIDNHDGLGAVDYSQCLAGDAAFQLTRTLNEPSICAMLLDCNATNLLTPVKYGRVMATSDAGAILFTGYVSLVPQAMLAGAGIEGPVYLQKLSAISDELLLDQQPVPVTAGSVGLLVGPLMQALTQRVDPVRIGIAVDNATNAVGQFVADAADAWSVSAGALAAMVRSGYRVINQELSVLPIGTTTHTLSDAAGTLDVSRFTLSQARALANDVTVCGESEAQAYVTDVFHGDGTTTTFQLTRTPMQIGSLKGELIADSFAGPALNSRIWQALDPGSRFSLTSAGLAVDGGNGIDGQTILTAIDNAEMGGVLVLTVGGVQVAAGSDGYVGCFYAGSVLLENLFAGFHVTQSSGNTIVVAIVDGTIAGASTTLVSGRAYTLRLRYACRETQRVFQSYYVDSGAGTQMYGGGAIAAAGQVVFEVQDTTDGTNQPATVLYDGSVNVSPATCFLCAINSPAFTGSLQSVALEQTGTTWVRSLPANGSAFTRRLGLATSGADCKLEMSGKLVFYATSVPQAGELVTVTYRTVGRAVARLSNPASITAQGTAVVPGVSRWIGSVTKPAARSSADCENAAIALLAISTRVNAAWAGTYESNNLQQTGDVWPGDLLAVEASFLNLAASLLVKSVSIDYLCVQPELLRYSIAFANDWADGVGMKTSTTVPKDVWQPQVASSAPASLANLNTLAANVSGTQITVSAGMTAPTGGGFEVRRVDWRFGPGSDETLVLRSPVADFGIVREAAMEQYYVRMYDASTPPNYSRFSSMVCASVPL